MPQVSQTDTSLAFVVLFDAVIAILGALIVSPFAPKLTLRSMSRPTGGVMRLTPPPGYAALLRA